MSAYTMERKRTPSEIIQTLQKEGIIDQMRQAGIIHSDQSVERLLEKAREVERSSQRARVKGWWVICGSCGGKGICLGCIEGEF
jgi:predicted methyltransferase